MARVAGVAYLKADGYQFDLVGSFNVSPDLTSRQMLVGQDGVHGYSEMPRVPYIEGDVRLTNGLTSDTLAKMTDVTVTAELANGLVVTLTDACTTGGQVYNTRDGLTHVRWEGMDATQFASS